MSSVENRRKHPRIPVNLSVPVVVIEGGREREMTGTVANLSESGLLLESPAPLPKKARIQLRILWPPGRTCLASGQVVWQSGARAGVSLDQANGDFQQLCRVLALAEADEQREITRNLRSPLLRAEA